MIAASLAAVAGLVLVHVLAHRLKFLEGTPRSRWLSAAGGISLAYVFLHLLPELAEGQTLLGESGLGLETLEFEVYGLALIGLLAFYGLERTAQVHGELGRETIERRLDAGGDRRDLENPDEHPTFWLHLATYAIYNVIIGYLLLHRGSGGHEGGGGEAAASAEAGAHGGAGVEASPVDGGVASEGDLSVLMTFAIAMALHFLVTDYGLREDFRRGWRRYGRWILSVAVIAGWGLGVLVELPEIAVLGAIALLGGGVILNVLKEELPEQRRSRFGALLLGAVGYTGLLAFAH